MTKSTEPGLAGSPPTASSSPTNQEPLPNPIPLWKVLEDEYCEIHGPLPQSYVKERDERASRFCRRRNAGKVCWEALHHRENRKMLPLLYKAIHALPEKRTALCLSGGGIRSATFALGIIQGLAKARLLTRFDFLSTVSGGGYIGAWLSAWVERHQKGLRGVAYELAASARSPLGPEPEPVAHLREYSNYLAPKLGLLSADTWTLVASYLRNVALNWMVILPIFAVVLSLPRLLIRPIEWFKIPLVEHADLKPAAVIVMLVVGFTFQVLAFSFLERSRPIVRPTRSAREPRGRSPGQRSVLLLYWIPLLLASGLLPLAAWGIKFGTVSWPWIGRFLPQNSGGVARYLDHKSVWFLGFQMLVVTLAWLLSLGSVCRRTAAGGRLALLGDVATHLTAAAVAGWILWFAYKLPLFVHPRPYVVLAPPIYLLAMLTEGTLVRGLGSYWSSDGDREWSARAAAWILIAGAAWFLASEIVFFGPSYLIRSGAALRSLILSSGTLAAFATAILGKSGKTPATQELKALPGSSANPEQSGRRITAPLLQQLGLAVAAPLFFVFILLLIVLGTDWLLVRSPPLYGRQLDVQQVNSALSARGAFVLWLHEQRQTLEQMTEPDPARRRVLNMADVVRWQEAQRRLTELLEQGITPPQDSANPRGLPFHADESGLEWLGGTGKSTAEQLSIYLRKRNHSSSDEQVIDLLKQRLRGIAPAPAGGEKIGQAGVLQILATEEPALQFVLEGEDWHTVILKQATVGQTITCMAGFLALALLMGALININAFSLHGIYRNRLTRAYLGASRSERCRRRTFDQFTGFDPADDVPLHRLRCNSATNNGPNISDIWFWATFLRGENPKHHQVSRTKARCIYEWTRARLPGATAALPKTSLLELPSAFERILQEELDSIVQHIDLSKEHPFAVLLTSSDEVAGSAGATSATESSDPVKKATTLHTRTRRNCTLLYRAFPKGIARPGRLFPVLNMALNIVAGKRLAWQQRKAQSFTATALHCGSYPLGYRSSLSYGGGLAAVAPFNTGPMTLGTAVAISGAAANPNWGYHSSPFVAFLMTLLNVRLGVWLGNPGTPGSGIGERHWLRTFGNSAPMFAWRPLLSDAFALTDDTHPYVSLSDGGHFDNLGLYEMVLRRCHLIILSDAGQDSKFTFEDLGNAIRKIRIDLGVPIEFEGRIPICPRGVDAQLNAMSYCAVGTIHYSAVDPNGHDGTLIYIKPTFYGSEPADVYNYGQQSRSFPHESTADQFFTEAQFESYRHLGEYILTRIYSATKSGYGLFRLLAGPRSHVGLPTIFSVGLEEKEGNNGCSNRIEIGNIKSDATKDTEPASSDRSIRVMVHGTNFEPNSTVSLQYASGQAEEVGKVERDPNGEWLRFNVTNSPDLQATITVINPGQRGMAERSCSVSFSLHMLINRIDGQPATLQA